MSVDGVGLIFDGIEQILLKSVRCSAVAMCSFEKLLCCCFEVLYILRKVSSKNTLMPPKNDFSSINHIHFVEKQNSLNSLRMPG